MILTIKQEIMYNLETQIFQTVSQYKVRNRYKQNKTLLKKI
jgi:hypothetical protein